MSSFSVERFNEIRDAYVQRMVDEMSTNALIEFAYDTMYNNLEDYSDDQLIDEIANYDVDFLRDEIGVDADEYFAQTQAGLTA